MKVSQKLYNNGIFTFTSGDEIFGCENLLILGFGGKNVLLDDNIYDKLRGLYPSAEIVLCSTSGEIYDDAVLDETVSLVVIQFEKTLLRTVSLDISSQPDSYEAGKALVNSLQGSDLSYMLVISDGGVVNGSELVKGIEQANVNNIPVTGGLAGDGDKFNFTVVGCNETPKQGKVVAVGFYGDGLKVGHGSFGGWEIFGPEKKVTRSSSNRLYEIDGKSALDLYKQYLGKYADELPGSALLFPLYVRPEGSNDSVVRTILSVDNEQQSMVFAGDIPEGSYIRFMKANFDKIIDAATHAAGAALTPFLGEDSKPKLALLISCVGRKLILGKRIDEEIEAVKEVFGDGTLLSGFYSYGEISPLKANARCELHNQTMTITTFSEELT